MPKLTEKKLDSLAMAIWVEKNGIKNHAFERWQFIREDCVTDKYRLMAKQIAGLLGYK